jgi:hypothetical protein
MFRKKKSDKHMKYKLQRYKNFWEELIAYFPMIRQGPMGGGGGTESKVIS